MLYYLDSVIERKIGKTVCWREKNNFCLPPFVRCFPSLLLLLSWHNVHRQSGWHSAMCEGRKGGFDRGDVKDCCQPKRGRVVQGITFCVFCPPQNLLVCCFLLIVWFFEEENSCHTRDYCAPFSMCLEDIVSVCFMLFLGVMEGWKFVFWVTMFLLGLIHLCASLCF